MAIFSRAPIKRKRRCCPELLADMLVVNVDGDDTPLSQFYSLGMKAAA